MREKPCLYRRLHTQPPLPEPPTRAVILARLLKSGQLERQVPDFQIMVRLGLGLGL